MKCVILLGIAIIAVQSSSGSSITDRLEALEKAVQRNSLTGSIWFDAIRIVVLDAWCFGKPNGCRTKITYQKIRQSTNYQAMNKGTGVFTAPLAGTYQFFLQVYKVSHFLLLTHGLTILLFTYTCVCIRF